jgi:hypothetical protein
MRFKEWFELQETMTTTADIAGFKRITIPLVRRMYPPEIATMFADNPPPENYKKVYSQPQVKE